MTNPTVFSLQREINRLPADERLNAVERLLEHPDADYRMLALQVASAVGHASVGDFCLRLLNDPIWYVRCSACEFAYHHRLRRSADPTISLLENDPHEIVRSLAALSLAQTGGIEHISHLETLLDQVTGRNHEGTPVRNILQRSIDRIKERPINDI